MGAEIAKAISAPDRPWPAYLPRECAIYFEPLGKEKVPWPHRLEWWGPAPPKPGESLLLEIEFRNPKLNRAALRGAKCSRIQVRSRSRGRSGSNRPGSGTGQSRCGAIGRQAAEYSMNTDAELHRCPKYSRMLLSTELARAMREGLEARRSLGTQPFGDVPPPSFTSEVRHQLSVHAELLALPPMARAGLFSSPAAGPPGSPQLSPPVARRPERATIALRSVPASPQQRDWRASGSGQKIWKHRRGAPLSPAPGLGEPYQTIIRQRPR